MSLLPAEQALRALTAAQARLDAARIALVARVEAEQSFDPAYRGVTSWSSEVCRVDHREAKRWVALARRGERLPGMLAALADGTITVAHLEAVTTGLRDVEAEVVAELEPVLLEAAEVCKPRDLRVLLEHVKTQAEPARAAVDEESAFERRRLDVARTIDGTVMLNGRLDAVSGEWVVNAIAAFSAPERESDGGRDPRTPGQRRADGWVEICRRVLGQVEADTRAGSAQLLVMVDGRALLPAGDARCDAAGDGGWMPGRLPFGLTGDGVMLSPAAVEHLSCDARVALAVVDDVAGAFLPRALRRGHHEPLWLGRTQRVVSPGLRRALIVRDLGCVHPGCTMPASWCQAHHLIPWMYGGPTDLPNLALLCSFHHHHLHATGRNLSRQRDGTWQVVDDPLARARLRDGHIHSDHDHPPIRAA